METNKGKNKGKNTDAGGAKYTRLTCRNIGAILVLARASARPFICSADFDGLARVEEYVERPGTFFIDYSAETWRKAEAFCAAVCGAAWALGRFAEVQTRWSDNCGDGGDDGKRRLVSVYVAASDVMDEDGHAVA